MTELTGELAEVVSKHQKAYGDHVISKASQKAQFTHIPTGVFTLDMALLGGVPEGLITSFYGWESSGKTTLALRAIGRAQLKHPDKAVALIDIEGTYDAQWGAVHGIDNEKLVLVQPESGEQALDITDNVIRAEETSMVVVDSLAALIPLKEIQDSIEDQQVGLQARMIGKFLRKVQQAMLDERTKRQHRPALININQWRYKIGVFRGDPRVLPGGVAQKFANSVQVEIKCKETIGKDSRDMEIATQNDHSFMIKKNKVGNSIKSGDFVMIRDPSDPLGAGFIDDGRAVATWAKKVGVITGGGSSWRIDGVDHKFSNLQGIVNYFYADPEYFYSFQHRLISMQREAVGLSPEGWL
jgi:recombination protein RecA